MQTAFVAQAGVNGLCCIQIGWNKNVLVVIAFAKYYYEPITSLHSSNTEKMLLIS